jgi:hypothetical protein
LKRTIYIGAGLAVLLAIAAFVAWSQTVFNTVAVTNSGQFVNAQLSDNVYVDMSTSPPKLRARRPTLNIRPVEQPDNAWQLPVTAQLLPGYQLLVIVNGLEMTQDLDYKFDLATPRRIVPIDPKDPTRVVKWHFTDQAGNDAGPYTVKVHLFP